MAIHPSRILYKDDALLIVDKLPGELVVKGSGKVDKLPLLDFLKKEYPGIHPLNRLDFETSGIVVFARTKRILAEMLEKKFTGWTKVYTTIVMGRVKKDAGEIDMPLPARAKGEGNVRAVTRYKVFDRFPTSTLIEAQIDTGRHHQIRRHFAMIKHPLVLDDVYGDQKFNRSFGKALKFRRFFLHASSVTLPHPVTGKPVTVTAPLPAAFTEVLERLRKVD